ncbi:MAG: hypothetical protein ACLU4N_02865 [Butyricimonas faecihominis]
MRIICLIFTKKREVENADYRRERFRNSNGYYTPLQKCRIVHRIFKTKPGTPLIRLPEMYLIVAESYLRGANIDLTEAVLFEDVAENRSNYIDSGYTRDELLTLMNEYRREFCRGCPSSISRIGADIPNSTIVMSDENICGLIPLLNEMGRS